MPRKFLVFSAMMLGVTLSVAGFAVADGDKPLEKQMTAIQKSTNSIRKATRTLPAWKKDAASVATEAAKISKEAADAKKDTGPAKAQKKTQAEWEKLMDDLIKSADDLHTLAKKSDATQAQAKDAFSSLNKSCSACHSVFRVDED